MPDDAIVRYLLCNADWWFIKNFSAARNIFSLNWAMKIPRKNNKINCSVRCFLNETLMPTQMLIFWDIEFVILWLCTRQAPFQFLKAKCGKFKSTFNWFEIKYLKQLWRNQFRSSIYITQLRLVASQLTAYQSVFQHSK